MSVQCQVDLHDHEIIKIETVLRTASEQLGWKAGDLFMAIRIAVTGTPATPAAPA